MQRTTALFCGYLFCVSACASDDPSNGTPDAADDTSTDTAPLDGSGADSDTTADVAPDAEPAATFVGRVYVQPVGEGLASYHFDDAENMYISYAAANGYWRFEDTDTPLPVRKDFEEVEILPEAHTFYGVVDWSEQGTVAGASRWEFEMVFSDDYSAIAGGQILAYSAEGELLSTLQFEEDLRYRELTDRTPYPAARHPDCVTEPLDNTLVYFAWYRDADCETPPVNLFAFPIAEPASCCQLGSLTPTRAAAMECNSSTAEYSFAFERAACGDELPLEPVIETVSTECTRSSIDGWLFTRLIWGACAM